MISVAEVTVTTEPLGFRGAKSCVSVHKTRKARRAPILKFWPTSALRAKS